MAIPILASQCTQMHLDLHGICHNLASLGMVGRSLICIVGQPSRPGFPIQLQFEVIHDMMVL